MYYQIELLKILHIPHTEDYHISFIKANKDRNKICVLTANAITFWLTAVSF